MEDLEALRAEEAALQERIAAAMKANRAAVIERVKKDIKDYKITVTEIRSVLNARKRKSSTKSGEADGEKKTRTRRSKKDAAA